MARPLITSEELLPYISREDVRVLDCRWYLGEPEQGLLAYRAGHIPGAMHASLDSDLSGANGPGRHPLPSPETFAATLSRLGVTASTRVVAYDDCGGAIASRLWWMLTDQGHRHSSVLDGGIQAWIRDDNAMTTEEPLPAVGDFRTRPWRGVVDREAVAERPNGTKLIDSRSTERYQGRVEPVDPKAGHIPGAISHPQSLNLSSDLTFLSPERLREHFSGAGLASDSTEAISSCGSGVTACHNILAMEVAGIARPSLYVGSWSDWSSTDLPIEKGNTP